MGRRKKSIVQFNDKLSNIREVYTFFLKGFEKTYPNLESDMNIRLEFISSQIRKWKSDPLSIYDEYDLVRNEYREMFRSNLFSNLILSKIEIFLSSFLFTIIFNKLHPRLEEIIPEELRHVHYDGQAIVSVKPTIPHYQTILKEAIDKRKPIKPVKNVNPVIPKEFHCQHCQAPVDYLYLNSPNQVLCKCCKRTSSIERVRYSNQQIVENRCPHCNHKLVHRKDRSGFTVSRCNNYKCSLYLSNKEKATKIIEKYPDLNLKLENFKLHYTYRHFNFEIELLKDQSISPDVLSSVNRYKTISSLNIFNHPIMLLCLAYRHNYSISKSKIASIITELHDAPISSQTVDNYLDLMANILRPFVENYPYKVSQKIVADETYIKIQGKQYYLYRYFDYDTNIIISQYLSDKRDTIATYTSFNKCLTTIKDQVDLKNLTLIVDGYTPYQIVANDLNSNYKDKFNIKVIPLIGLKNHNAENKPYVPDKQAIERNHRDFKVAYHNSTNFRSVEAALNYITLHQAVHNFITKFRKADRIPVKVASYSPLDGILDRWEKLILESINYINKSNLTVA